MSTVDQPIAKYRLWRDSSVFAQAIARSYSDHMFRTVKGQLRMWIGDDYVSVDGWPDAAWQQDMFIDDDYIFGAHLVVAHRDSPGDALNHRLETLFIHRHPVASLERSDEYQVKWGNNEVDFFNADRKWYHHSRLRFLNWYHEANGGHSKRQTL